MNASHFDLLESPLAGRNLVEASAGTGKTYAIAGLFVRLLLEEGLRVDEILVVTFTEAATEELRERIRTRVRGALLAFRTGQSDDEFLAGLLRKSPDHDAARRLLTSALRSFDEAPVFTIHGFCQRVLQEKAFECGAAFDTELITDESPLVQEVVEDFWRVHLYGASREFIRYVYQQGYGPETLAKFVGRAARSPELRVIPERADADLAPLEAACRDAYESVRRLWPASREPVQELLTDAPGLNRQSYRRASIPGWVEQMDQYAALGDPLARFGKFDKFCAGALVQGTKKNQTPPEHPFCDACQILGEHLERLTAAFERKLLSLKARLLEYVKVETPRRKAEQNLRSFDDLLRSVQAALAGDRGAALAQTLRDRYPAALIDEFQDTDPVQYSIFRRIYPDEHAWVFLIGDPKQAIYSFRGADIFAYMDAARQVDRRYTLGTNWRSGPDLIRATNRLFENAPDPFVFNEISFRAAAAAPAAERKTVSFGENADRSPLQLWFADRSPDQRVINKTAAARTLPAAVAAEIARLLRVGGRGAARIGEENVAPGDMAVLVRTNRQTRQVQQALRRLGIPSVIYSSESLFDAPEAEELLRVLAAVAEPGNEGRARAALATDLLGCSGNDLARMLDDDATWERWIERLGRYHDLWVARGFIPMARALLAGEHIRGRLPAHADGDRRLTNVLHCVEVLQRAAVENRLGPEGLLKWFGRQIEERAEKDEYQLRLETDEKAVKVVTIHKSKGLEYPIVFCPFCWGESREGGDEVAFHDPEEGQSVVLDLGSEDFVRHKRLAEREALAENLRLLYVALTRAKNRCYLVWGAFRGAGTSAMAYLLHPPPGAAAAGEDVVDRTETRFVQLDDGQLIDELRSLALAVAPALEISPVPAAAGEPYAPPASEEVPPSCREFWGAIPADWGISSFSSMTSGRLEASELPDRDEVASREEPAADAAPSETSPETLTIFDFPRGAKAGTCLHAVFEEVDYRAADSAATEALVEEKLALHGFESCWTIPVCENVERVLRAPLEGPAGRFTLAELSAADRIHEMEFYLPMGRVTARGLTGAFAASAGLELPEELPGLLERLEFKPTRGFLKGFIDLVFHHAGRYYLLDWKSNFLGDKVTDYGPAALQRAMTEHLYPLQYHLYTVALHRYLAQRLERYEYERHFGGAFYVFLRGVDPDAGPDWGVYRARPTRSTVEMLDRYLSEGTSPNGR